MRLQIGTPRMIGAFQGARPSTTPTGWRMDMARLPATSEGITSPEIWEVIDAASDRNAEDDRRIPGREAEHHAHGLADGHGETACHIGGNHLAGDLGGHRCGFRSERRG